MLVSDIIEVNINRQNYNYYANLNYDIDKDLLLRNAKVMVNLKDIPPHSKSTYVKVKCDYCGKVFTKQMNCYTQQHKFIDKDCCCNYQCRMLKIKEVEIFKYGSNSKNFIHNQKKSHLGRDTKYTMSDLNKVCNEKNIHCISDIEYNAKIFAKKEYDFRCNIHTDFIFQTTFSKLQHCNNPCKICRGLKSSANRSKSSISQAVKIGDSKNYTILTDFIKNIDDIIQFICNKHPEYGVQNTSLWGLIHSKNNCKCCNVTKETNHWNWSGGKTSDQEKIRKSINYKEWRKQVYERDNYTCQCCGKTGVALNAHHILNFSTYPDLRFDVSNGVTLCEECHSFNKNGSFHNVYGNHNNSLEQLKEYIYNKQNKIFLENVK